MSPACPSVLMMRVTTAIMELGVLVAARDERATAQLEAMAALLACDCPAPGSATA